MAPKVKYSLATPKYKRRPTGQRNEPVDGRQYTAGETEFIMAMDRYKRANRRPFPTWREVYHVFLSLGYRKSSRHSSN